MKIAPGNESYKCDHDGVVARGVTLTDLELDNALKTHLPPLLEDHAGSESLGKLMGGLSNTSFADARLREILKVPPTQDGWRYGEALAESFLSDHRDCEFPWPSGRDLKNPSASPAGADLVGFVPSGNSHRFAFGEVKTSQQAASPPSVMTGRHGLSKQIEDLRDRPPVKDGLVRYLALRATNATWEPRFKAATKTYLNDPTDVHLFGMLVRDTSPHQDDLRTRTVALAKKRPPSTTIELRAIYLPSASIGALATRAASLKTGGRA